MSTIYAAFCWASRSENLVAISTSAIAIFTIVLAYVGCLQTRLIRNEFISTHRPKIAVRAFAFDWGEFNIEEQYPISFIYCNEGSSPAKIIEIGTAIIYSDEYDRIDTNFAGFKIRKIAKTLGTGEQDTGYSADAVCTNNIFRNQVFQEKGGRFFVGYIAYEDRRGIKRPTGFSRRCNRYMNWEHYPNEEYDYSY